MVVSYVSKTDRDSFSALKDEYIDVNSLSSLDEFVSFYSTSKNRDIVLIYRVDSLEEIEQLSNLRFGLNLYMIVIGKNDINFSLLAGKIGVDKYIDEESESIELVKSLLLESQSIIKTRRGKSNISVFTGIGGGVGTTTISMNLALDIAKKNPEKNVLFLDFAYTKSISNLFFKKLQPKKSIIDIASLQNLNIEELFSNGLEKYDNNFFFVPGIQSHIQRDVLEKPENIQKFLNFINYAKEYFDVILIDIGVFEDVELEIDIQEIADNIVVVSELSIPSISILKTYIDIIDKSGWYKKTKILINRADSFGSLTKEEASMILSKGLKHKFNIDYSLPNDAMHLRECWNEAKLVQEIYPESKFMKALSAIGKDFIDSNMALKVKSVKENLSFLDKVKKWL